MEDVTMESAVSTIELPDHPKSGGFFEEVMGMGDKPEIHTKVVDGKWVLSATVPAGWRDLIESHPPFESGETAISMFLKGTRARLLDIAKMAALCAIKVRLEAHDKDKPGIEVP